MNFILTIDVAMRLHRSPKLTKIKLNVYCSGGVKYNYFYCMSIYRCRFAFNKLGDQRKRLIIK